MKSRTVPLLIALSGALTWFPMTAQADQPLLKRSNGRVCLAAPHKPGRVARLPGQARMPSNPGLHRTFEAHPRCRYQAFEEAERARDAEPGAFGLPLIGGSS